MSQLSEQEIGVRLNAISHWKKVGSAISRTFVFEDFLESIDFINQIAGIAETNNHHPDIEIHWNKVTLAFTTRDQNGLTEKDFDCARQCEDIFGGI